MSVLLSRFTRIMLMAICAVAVTGLTVPGALAATGKELGGLHWRNIGPYRGGRTLAVTGVAQKPDTFYFGSVVGGVWKTDNAGASWTPIFDKEPIASVGAIAVAPSDPNVIYVGTGESALREDISFGDGVYRSTDAGKTWQHMGLADTRHIGKIIVDPKDPNIVLVAAVGHAYGPNAERGVFRSTDGGKTWKKVLYRDDKTGAIDLSFDPDNPRIVYAATWQVQRSPWHLESGGPGSGIYKSTDEGETWKRLSGHGLPEGVWGRLGISAAGGDRVYAVIDANKGGLYRSDDGGKSWDRVSDDPRFLERPWYFMRVYADPSDPDIVYVCNTGFYRSTDGGHRFEMLNTPHGDNHGLWIDPRDGRRMIEGNDGGATITVDGGKSWSTEMNQPTAQFYHVATDDRFPYYVYGAQQDNGTEAVPSRSDMGRISQHDWDVVGENESGYVLPDPKDAQIVYSGSYFGILSRFNGHTGQVQDVSPWPYDADGYPASEMDYRFTWTMPMAFSPQDPNVLYHGSQYLLRSDDAGHSWTRISPDLTRDDKHKQGTSGGPVSQDNASAEYYDLIYSIAPSSVAEGEIWVGTDDGLIQLTRDGGKTWHNVTPRGMPQWAKVSMIDASTFDAGTAYVAVEAHKLDDFHAYIFQTHDYGRTWERTDSDIKAPAYVRAVREDPKQKGLLYAATETGVYVSFDDGKHWKSLQLDLPVTSVRDLEVKNGDLIAATHGRGFWILDDIEPLRAIAAGTDASVTQLYAPRKALRLRTMEGGGLSYQAFGENPADGAYLDYTLAKKPGGHISMEIRDASGALVRRFVDNPPPADNDHPPEFPGSGPSTPTALDTAAGMHRLVWDLRREMPPAIPGSFADMGGPVAPLVLPGKYTVTLTVDGKHYSQSLEVAADPRVKTGADGLAAQYTLMMKLDHAVRQDHAAANAIIDVRKQLADQRARLGDAAAYKGIVGHLNALDAKLAKNLETFYQYRGQATEAMLNYPTRLNGQLSYLETLVDAADVAPTEPQQAMFTRLRKELDAALARWGTLQQQDLAQLNAEMTKAGIKPVTVIPADGI